MAEPYFTARKRNFTRSQERISLPAPYSSSISFRPSFLRMARPVGVAAQPPRAVSRRSGLIRRPTERIAITVSSKGIRLGMPASAISALISAFITPIEREDIIELSHCIDNMTDKIEDVFLRLYTNNVQKMHPDAVDLAKVVIHCCESVKEMLVEFPNFKRSKKLKEHIIKINTMEEEADRRFISCMAKLHRSGADALEIIVWREIYKYLEDCADACENVADVVEGVVMDNT